MTKYLSKSSYMAGLDCKRKLWQLLWDRSSAGPLDGMAQLNMEFGKRFGVLAHHLYPDGILIDIDVFKLDRAVEDTHKAIKLGSEVILEATFCHGHFRVLSDIVEKQADGSWHLIEVKSSTSVKDIHYPDLAYQKWVMEKNGYTVSRCSVIHADKNGVWPDSNSIFKISDVTEKVNKVFPSVDREVEEMKPLMEEGAETPDARQCYSKKCHKCVFKKTVCWSDIKDITIYDLVHARKIPLLEALDILYIKDVPDDFELYKNDKKHLSRIKRQSIDIDTSAVENKLQQLEYPIYFLDFESVSVPVPLFDGNRPWEKLAFQYSLHILEEDGNEIHKEFLHQTNTDPSVSVAEALIRDIGDTGSLVVYHADMEKGVLKDLRDKFPQHETALQGMIDRLWDLELIFKHDYRHWKFGSKSSIKVVLPTLLPDQPGLSYKSQVIQEGGAASMAWIDLIETDDFEEKNRIANDLKEYCKLDTLAMVELTGFLANLEGGYRG